MRRARQKKTVAHTMSALEFGVVVRAADPQRMHATLPPLMESLKLSGVPHGATFVIMEPLCAAAHHVDFPRWVVYVHDTTVSGENFVKRVEDARAELCATQGTHATLADLPVGVYDTHWLKDKDASTPDADLVSSDTPLDSEQPYVLGDFQYPNDPTPLKITWHPCLDVYRFV